jgi:hypothetical protein
MGTPFVFVFVESYRVAGRQGDEAVSVENVETLGRARAEKKVSGFRGSPGSATHP